MPCNPVTLCRNLRTPYLSNVGLVLRYARQIDNNITRFVQDLIFCIIQHDIEHGRMLVRIDMSLK
jgi:hypothetical protein